MTTRAIITSTFTTTRNASSPFSPQLPELGLPFVALVFNTRSARSRQELNGGAGCQCRFNYVSDNASGLAWTLADARDNDQQVPPEVSA